jgi:hypothetical protein
LQSCTEWNITYVTVRWDQSFTTSLGPICHGTCKYRHSSVAVASPVHQSQNPISPLCSTSPTRTVSRRRTPRAQRRRSVASMDADGEDPPNSAPPSSPPKPVQVPSYPEVTIPFLSIRFPPPFSSGRGFLWFFAARGSRSQYRGLPGPLRR